MFYGWENTSGSAFIEGKNLKKCTQQKKDGLKVLNSVGLQLNKGLYYKNLSPLWPEKWVILSHLEGFWVKSKDPPKMAN